MPSPHTLAETAPGFVEIAHRIVWATVGTVAPDGRPWSRVLHPLWQWDGTRLVGWVGTSPTSTKRAHLAASPYATVGYWDPTQDTATANCRAELRTDDETRTWLWEALRTAPEPVGYDPAIIPPWRGDPLSPTFAALRLDPWLVRVQPAATMLGGRDDLIREWRES
ncbi:pyridoxamine 5-phosphate oxidase [Pseudonocardia sp. CNS-139]|nr:pyridoxamine 5-phosphate oxidase [Pseudonocardia sp. CNS-139]